jgi:xylulokinase
LIREGEIAAFCDSTNRWLPLLCTMNVTVATEMVRTDFGMTHEQFAGRSGQGAGRFGRADAAALPRRRAHAQRAARHRRLVRRQSKNFHRRPFRARRDGRRDAGHELRLRRLRELGVKPRQIRVTGGGAKSKLWRQIMADVFDAEVVTVKVSEGAAYGAALQALWCWRLQRGERVKISDITGQFVHLNKPEAAHPAKAGVQVYREWQTMQDELSLALHDLAGSTG